MSGGVQPVVQAAVGDGLSFNPFSFCQDGRAPAAVGVGRGEVVDALVVSAVVVVGDERRDLGFEVAGQEVVFQQDAVLEGLVPALDRGVPLLASRGRADRAPWISSLRRYLLPRLVMPTSRGLPPVVTWRGTSPSQAARSRPRAKLCPSPMAATNAVAFSTPIPGIVASRRAAGSLRARAANSLSKAAIRRSSSRHSARISSTSQRIRGLSVVSFSGSGSAASGTALTLDTLCFGVISAKEWASRGGGDQACGLGPRFERRRRRGRDGNHLFDLYH